MTPAQSIAAIAVVLVLAGVFLLLEVVAVPRVRDLVEDALADVEPVLLGEVAEPHSGQGHEWRRDGWLDNELVEVCTLPGCGAVAIGGIIRP